MSAADAVFAIIQPDSMVAFLLTGGVYLYKGQENILDRIETPAAYDATKGLLLPCAVVRGRATGPFGGLRDSEAHYTSMRQVVEIWLYNDRSGGYEVLEEARAQIFKLIDGERLADGYLCDGLVNRLEDLRAPELNNACLDRDDYIVVSAAKPLPDPIVTMSMRRVP